MTAAGTAICPGRLATDMNRQLVAAGQVQGLHRENPMVRWGELHDIAGAAVFPASDDGDYGRRPERA